jgi:hypothetical protein
VISVSSDWRSCMFSYPKILLIKLLKFNIKKKEPTAKRQAPQT